MPLKSAVTLLMKKARPGLLAVLGALLTWAAVMPSVLHASDGSGGEVASKEIVDPFKRESPRSMQIGLFNVLGSSNAQDVAPFVEGADAGSEESLRRIRAFVAALDRRGSLTQRISLSIEPEGNLADGLAPDLEEIGTLALDEGDVPILIRRTQPDEGPAIWQVAAETVDQVAFEEYEEEAETVDEEAVGTTMVLGAPLSTWLLITGLGLSAFAVIVLSFKIICRKLGVDDRTGHRPLGSILLAAFPPLTLMGVYAAVERLAEPFGASLVERTAIARYSGLAIGFAAIWLAWRLAGVINRWMVHWLRSVDQPAWIGLTNFVTRLVRLALIVVAIGTFLATFAIDVTTGLAALGIGGVALALGARKAVEDIVGSVMILADKPVRIGDRCKVDGVEGEVLDIGMRSTRIQTYDRTITTIPNNVLASQNIENMTLRDRYQIDQRFLLAYDTPPDLLARALQETRNIVEAQEDYIHSTCPVRFEGFTPAGFELRIKCYLAAESYSLGHLRKEKVLIALLQRFGEIGVSIVPSAQRIELSGGAPH